MFITEHPNSCNYTIVRTDEFLALLIEHKAYIEAQLRKSRVSDINNIFLKDKINKISERIIILTTRLEPKIAEDGL